MKAGSFQEEMVITGLMILETYRAPSWIRLGDESDQDGRSSSPASVAGSICATAGKVPFFKWFSKSEFAIPALRRIEFRSPD
jgi:hypothetical protein